MEAFSKISENALEMVENGIAKTKVLTYLAEEAERLIGHDSAVSILLLDAKGLLRNGASPRLPEDYLRAIDGIRPDPAVGTCAAAAATGQVVLTPDFRADNKWNELRHLPLSIGYSGAWSMPIKAKNGIVLGTFGTYFRQIRKPSEHEMKGVEILADAASQVLMRSA